MHNPFVEAVLDRLAQEVVLPQPNSGRMFDALLTSLTVELGQIIKLGANDKISAGQWRLDRVRGLIQEPTAGRWLNVSELAERCSVSRRHLMREWKAATGTTLHSYIAERRFERAKALLRSSTLKLREVSGEAGFADPSHFSAEFKKRVGCSPSEYRRRVALY